MCAISSRIEVSYSAITLSTTELPDHDANQVSPFFT
jgi:hypothetical protein